VNIMHWFWRDVTDMMAEEFAKASDSESAPTSNISKPKYV